MITYYKITNTYLESEVGKFPQSQDMISTEDLFSKRLLLVQGRVGDLKKPIIPDLIMEEKSKNTDLISSSSISCLQYLIISELFLTFMLTKAKNRCQYFCINLIRGNCKIKYNLFYMKPHKKVISWQNCLFSLKDSSSLRKFSFETNQEFLEF